MKLIIHGDRIAATATDGYTGPDEWIEAPEDFDAARLGEYRVVDGELVLAPIPPLTQFERDQSRYARRAAARDQLLAYMAADNMARVRAGVWSVQDLTSLLDDPAVATANAYMGTLSYELAAQAIAGASTPLLTSEIRADWIARLSEHFYLEV